MHGRRFAAMTADQIKDGKPVLVANNRFAVDQTGANRELAHRHCDEGKARREIVSGAGNQSHAGRIPRRQDAKAVMFDFVNPADRKAAP